MLIILVLDGNNNFPIDQFKVNEYLVVLKPHEELVNKIKSCEMNLLKNSKLHISILKTHLPLVNFLGLEMNEEKLLNRLETISMGICPIKIELKDYGSYPSHTLFINVTSKLPLLI